MMKLAVYAPVGYILPSRMAEIRALYDTAKVEAGPQYVRQVDP